MRVWVYPQREFRELGETRFLVSWEAVKPSAQGKEEIDIDEDIDSLAKPYKTKDAAVKFARRMVQGMSTAFGCATVSKEVVDWFVQEDRIAEWTDAGEVEYIDGLQESA